MSSPPEDHRADIERDIAAGEGDQSIRQLPGWLWRRLRADPLRSPEILALAAAELHGPAAARWVQDRRAMYAYDAQGLARIVKRKHAALARYTGAATGVGGIVTAIPDLASLGWIQSRLVFFLAAAYGFDPRDPMRPAELLVLQEIYRSPQEARSALDGTGRHFAFAYADKKMSETGRDRDLLTGLASFAGKRLIRRGAQRYIPLIGMPINAVANELDTRRLADRAIAFYGGPPPG